MLRTILIGCLLSTLIPGSLKAQAPSSSLDTLYDAEIRLMDLSESMVQNYDEMERFTSGKNFIRTMVRALRVQGSYQYPFDSLRCLSKLVAPDDRFRIFTWNLSTNDETFHQYGVIQLNPEKWSKKELEANGNKLIFPLIDRSDFIRNPYDTITNNDMWWGALYYKMAKTQCKKISFYTLIGFDAYTAKSNRKVVDVLYFKDGQPVFGAPVFDVKGKRKICRMIWEYNNNANMTLRFEDQNSKLVFENIVPPKLSQTGMYETYLPDGTFDYMIWKNCFWEKQSDLLNRGE